MHAGSNAQIEERTEFRKIVLLRQRRKKKIEWSFFQHLFATTTTKRNKKQQMKRILSHPSTDVLDGMEIGKSHEANPKCATIDTDASTRRTTGGATLGRFVFISCLVATAFDVFHVRNPVEEVHDALRFLQNSGPSSGYDPSRGGGGGGGGIYGGQPSKGNTECAELPLYYGESGPNPCHYSKATFPPSSGTPSGGEGDRAPPEGFRPSNETDVETEGSSTIQVNPFPPELPENIVNLTVYVAQNPQTPSVAHRVAMIVSNEMNKTIENMMFYTKRNFPPGAVPDDALFDEVLEDGEEPIVFGTKQVNIAIPNQEEPHYPKEGAPSEFVLVGNGQSESRPKDTPRNNRFDMIYIRTSSTVALQEPGVRWWWELDIFYICFWEDGDPVGAKVMDAIRVNMTDTIREKLDEIQSLVRNDTKREDLLLGLDILDIPSDISKDINDTGVEGGSRVAPLDVGEWSWTRYFGFVVLLSTCSGLIVTSQVGAIRRRRKVRQQVWGNLASEEGVKELLNTGWILREDRMEVFDKTRVGYRDDDSMLIGGFEQREPGPGTEIVTPTLTTHEESSTRGPSTAPRPLSTRQEDP